MVAPDLTRLGPGDAEVALRSFVRRYAAELLAVPGDDRGDELAARLGPAGESALGVVSDVTRTWGVLGHELHRVLTLDDPLLHPAAADPRQRHWDTAPPDTVDEALTLLGHEVDALLDVMAGVTSADEWTRKGEVAGGGTLSALDLVKEAVRVGAEGLDRVRDVLAAVRDQDRPSG